MIVPNIKNAGGTPDMEADSVAKVSFWYVPGGTNYDDAFAVAAYFNDVIKAAEFERRYSAPPEMAHMSLIG